MFSSSKKIKVLYIQGHSGGGSLIALHEMLKELDPRLIEPVILCYFRNKYTLQLEDIPNCEVIYADENLISQKKKLLFSRNKWLNVFLIQYNALKQHFLYDKSLARYIKE